jgi:HEAT repeat protein
MPIAELFNNKAIKSKEKTQQISTWLLNNTISITNLISYAQHEKDLVKATCIEAIEFATKQNPTIANEETLYFVTQTLTEKAPRVKWESAKVIGNIAHLFPSILDNAITNLLDNAEHSGTVVRWSTAYALGEILKLKTPINKELLPTLEAIYHREEKISIKKIYLAAIKKLP